MPNGPAGKMRPRNPNQHAKLMIENASGEVEDMRGDKDKAAQAMVGRAGRPGPTR